MKIMLVTNSYLPKTGGLEIAVYHIAHGLRRKGHSVVVVTGTDLLGVFSRDEEGVRVYSLPFIVPRILLNLGGKRFLMSLIKSVFFPFLFPVVLYFLMVLLLHEKPDILNLHYIAENAFYMNLVRKKARCPYVVSIHGNDIEGISHRSVRAAKITTATLNKADMILSNSRYLVREAECIADDIVNKAVVVGNGVSLERFKGITPLPYRRKYLLSVANFAFKKGHDILILAYGLVTQRIQTPLPDLILAGDGPELSRCKRLVTKMNLEDHIFFTGKEKHENVIALLAGCSFFIHPARPEPFGIVLLEAMASGKAIIATRTGGVPEILKEGENALLVPPDSVEALAEAIETFIKHPDFVSACGRKGQELVSKYSWDTIIVRYEKAYQKVIQ